MNTERAKRKLSAILSADVKGYSRLMGEDEVGTVRTLKDYREVMSKLIKEYRGRVVDSPGDNVLAEFASVVDALECSIEIQKVFKDKNTALPDNRKMEFRIGVNLGDVIEDEDRVYGDGVNIAARIEGLAKPGGICISGSGFEQVRNKLPLGYEYLGEHTVKNIVQPIKVYRVLIEPESAGKVIGEKGRKGRQWRWAAVAAVVLVGGMLALWNFYFRPPTIEPASKEKMAFPLPDKPSIAVLPFANMSGDPKEDYFSDGLTEQIITSLSMVPRLFVIARNSTFVYKGKAVKVQKVAEEQGVQYVLEGGVEKSEDRVRITVQLIDAIKGHHLWSERYDRELKDLFALQDEIVRQIMTAVQVELTEGQYASAIAGSTSNLKALECYWRASELWNRWSKEDNAAARQWAERAIELDPNFAGAFTLLGNTHLMDATQYGGKSPAQSMKRAEECAQKAISINDSFASAQSLMAHISRSQGKWDEALKYGEKALAINPNDPRIMISLALTMHYLGRFDEAIALTKKAMRISPYYPAMYLTLLPPSYILAGRYQEAIEASELMLERSRKGEINPLYAHVFLAEAYVGLGQLDKAGEQAKEVLKIDPKFSLESEKRLTAFKDPVIGERRLAALRKAGLPDKPPLPLPDKPSIAVLAFTNMSGNPKDDLFGDGLAEGIINGLSKSEHIFVIARNSSFTYKGKPVNIKQVAEEMGVRYVIEGSIQREGERLRITVQLIDAVAGHHLFSERYDRDLKDILNLQDEITMKVLTAVQVKLTVGESARISEKGTKNLDAYLKVLEARELKAGTMNKERVERAMQLLEEAIALDPEYAYAYSILSTAYCDLLGLGASDSPRESLRRAVELGKKAIALDESNSSAHANLAFPYIFLKEFDKAIEEAEKGVSLSPNSAAAYFALGTALYSAGRPQEAIPIFQKCLRLSPVPVHSQVLGFLANSYAAIGQYEEAIATYKKVLQIYGPDHLMAHLWMAATYTALGRENEARAEAAEVLRIDPKFSVEQFVKNVPADPAYKDRLTKALRNAGLN